MIKSKLLLRFVILLSIAKLTFYTQSCLFVYPFHHFPAWEKRAQTWHKCLDLNDTEKLSIGLSR